MSKEELKKEAWQYADKVCGWDKTQIFDYLVEAYLASAEPREKRIAELEAQIEEMNNQKVFLLQRVDAYDSTIDKQFYTTDEELAIEWSKYVKHSYWYGQAIELEEISDKERIKEELEND